MIAWLAAAVSIVVIGIVPVVMDRDSFPLSTYPMFSSRRTTTEPVNTAVAVAADGAVQRLNPMLISGSREVVFAGVTVGNAIRSGPDGVAALCAEIAERVAGARPGEAATVEILTEVFDSVAWFQGDRTPVERTVHGSCPVPGAGT
jgi:hypothetical protein